METVLVTGGTRGLGLATCELLVAEGYRVIATGRSMSDPLRALMGKANPNGRLDFEVLDLTATERIGETVGHIIAKHGDIGGLVNNAAVGLDGVLATMHDTQIETVIQVNLLATVLLTKYVSRSMLIRRKGRIVNIASVVANTGFSGLSVYAATKAGLIGFSRSLARELGKVGVTVNCVLPGFLATEMTATIDSADLARIQNRSALGRLATTGDVAATIAYLLSEQAAAISGTEVVVDAGSTA
ncbi:MAG: SDR family NAD(P)-dependent oxidoreductase [Planctomycetota bacterium]